MVWRDNPLYRWAQHTFLATSVVTFVLLTSKVIWSHALQPLLQGNLLMIVPLILGCLIFTNQFGRSVNWISRYPIWILMGVGTAFAIRSVIQTQVTQQILTILGKVKMAPTALGTLNNIIAIIFPIAVFSYFFFYFMHQTGVGRGISKLGRYCIMLAFGVGFGGAMMYNMTFVTYQLIWALKSGPPKPIAITAVAAIITMGVLAAIGYVVMKYEARVTERLQAS